TVVGSASDLGVGSSGDAYVTGSICSSTANFTFSSNAFQEIRGGSPGIQDAYVMKLDTNSSGASSLVYSTYLGGNVDETALGIAINSAGEAYVGGITNSPNFPTTADAIQSSFALGPNDVFLTKLNSSGDGLIFSTFL